ncbi:MAG: hypothetical protein ACC634_09670, partial [Hyphomicrobiales bacterium]
MGLTAGQRSVGQRLDPGDGEKGTETGLHVAPRPGIRSDRFWGGKGNGIESVNTDLMMFVMWTIMMIATIVKTEMRSMLIFAKCKRQSNDRPR